MKIVFGLVISVLLTSLASADQVRRPIMLADLDSVRSVTDLRISADGEQVAYTVQSVNKANDSQQWAVWVLDWDSGASKNISAELASAWSARWSPDGRQLAFLSSGRERGKPNQIWLYDPASEDLQQASEIKGGVSDFDWSPDSKHLVLIVESGGAPAKSIAPIIIDRFRFKRDGVGYLGDARRHLQLLDLKSGAVRPLTDGPYDEVLPAWSPDGSRIAFVSKRGPEADIHDNWDVYLIEPVPGAKAERLTRTEYAESNPESWGGRPVWSPDSRRLAFTIDRDPSLSYYAQSQLVTVSTSGEPGKILTAKLDRNTMSPQWSADGKSIYALIEDEMNVYLAAIPADGGTPTRLTDTDQTVRFFDASDSGRIVVIFGTPDQPYEIGSLDAGHIRKITKQNDAWVGRVQLGSVEVMEYPSGDGTRIRGLLLKPPGYEKGRRYPAILRIHGGPVGQFRKEFNFEWQLLAANGYVVLGVNPRGSSGRGEDFQRLIFGDLGHGDVPDLLAAIDFTVKQGIIDKDRLGIGGWSYGAMLTNYTIASDPRFKAATSGAGVSNMLALYGTDEWVRHWELELGRPWENTEKWLRLSYPFLRADQISTPTLFLVGELDLNVPVANSEQMYQALKSLGIDTRLIIYPGEYHNISRPSFRRDVLERYLAWYDKYLH
ncbi:MAG: S9 family peptidase [Gammaproteobacteria bacterium]|nr:MAG: S9 family peptidase [Gammaproteobacteria bacterium]